MFCIKKIYLLPLFVIDASVVFARAGGGGAGGGLKGIGVIIGIIYTLIVLYYVRIRNQKAKKLIDESHKTDPLWDYDKMIALSSDVFMRMQNAWTERNMDLVTDIVTER